MNNNRVTGIFGLSILLCSCSNYQTSKPERLDIIEAVYASGSISTEEQYVVSALADGYIESVNIESGDTASIGEKLLSISNDYRETQLLNAKTNLEYAKNNSTAGSPVLEQLLAQEKQLYARLYSDSINFFRHKKLLGIGGISKMEFEKAELTYNTTHQELVALKNEIKDRKKNLELEVLRNEAAFSSENYNYSLYDIESAVDGLVLNFDKREGELVKRGEIICEIASGEFIAELFVLEEDINKVRLGQLVFIELNTEKFQTHEAIVSNILPYFNTQEQSFIVEAKFIEPIDNLKSGTQLQANIQVAKRLNALVVPTEFLLESDSIYVKPGQKVYVRTGLKAAEYVEILSGITEDTKIYLPE
jgi:macrolide-specific efflux system membrane fusion protein